MPGPQPKLHLPYGQWPAADQQLWERAFSNDDPFSEAAGARLAKTSQHQYLFGWRRFLGFLAIHEPSALEIAPAERLIIERVRPFVTHLAETNTPRSIAIQIDALYKAARVMMPERDWTWLKAIKARLYSAAPPRSAPGPIITSVQLLDLGHQLMEESKPTSSSPLRIAEAVRYRDGLMFALLAFIPLRPKNVAALEIGRHLIQDANGWILIIPRAETKTGAPIEFAIPTILAPYLATYLDVVRPRMLRGRLREGLWVSPKGRALRYAAIRGLIGRHSEERLGFRIAPHDVRDAAATTWAIAAPGQIGVARDLLSHADLRTTTRHYNRARGIEASRAHTRLIAALKKTHRSN